MLYKLQYVIKDNNPLCKLISKFSVKDNQGEGVTNFFSNVHGVKLQEITGLGFLVQRTDNRLLLYNQEKENQLLKLKDFNLAPNAQISFDPSHSFLNIPCNDKTVKIQDQLDAPTGVVNPTYTGKKLKNSQQNQFTPFPNTNACQWLPAAESLTNF